MPAFAAWTLVSAARMGALDRYTIDSFGVSGDALMESAGRSVVDFILAQGAEALATPDAEVMVFCGPGNNGGDGFVIARHLTLLGVPVRTLLLGEVSELRGEAALNFHRAESVGCSVEPAWPLARPLAPGGVVVDALFGTGLGRALSGAVADLVRHLNARRAGRGGWCVAVDLPSGLDAGTGQILGEALAVDATVTVNAPKMGLALEPGRGLAGEVWVARIGIADVLPGEETETVKGAAVLWTGPAAARALPERRPDGHKGSFGHVLVIGGSRGLSGAAALSAIAAARAGAGLVSIGCPASLSDVFEAQCAEVMTAALPETPEGALAEAALDPIVSLAESRDVVALGPGLGREPETQALVRALVERIRLPLVIDADGLNALKAPATLRARQAGTILTPHPGEAARLLGTDAQAINADRVGAAQELATLSGAVVLLKGPGTVIACPDGRVMINPTGGPNLATGGSGDVLTGLVAALLAQGLAGMEAAGLGAYVHGRAGDRIARRRGEAGLLASELADEMPSAMQQLREEGREHGGQRDFGSATLLPFPGT
jgi:ADP-dependent NAD(P)H-hydrate dehydratase / NAD(P)H-hydrate epimerase